MATYYHNPRCSKSRQGLALLQEKGLSFTVKEYLKEGLEVEEVLGLAKKLGMHPSEFVRKKEAVFKDLDADKFSVEAWAEAIHKTPILLERPILVVVEKAIIGRPPERLLELC